MLLKGRLGRFLGSSQIGDRLASPREAIDTALDIPVMGNGISQSRAVLAANLL